MQSHGGRLSRSPSDWGATQLRFIVELPRAHSNFNLCFEQRVRKLKFLVSFVLCEFHKHYLVHKNNYLKNLTLVMTNFDNFSIKP